MKSLFRTLLVTLFCIMLVACSNELSAKDTVSSMLDSYKNQKWEECTNYFNGDDAFPDIDLIDDSTKGYETKQKLLMDTLCDIEYEILDVEEKENSAIVKVEIKAMNVGEQFMKGMKEAIELALDLSTTELSQLEITNQMMDTMFKPLEDCERTCVATIEVHLVKENGKWVISPNMEFINSIMGGLLDMTKQFSF